MRIIRTLASAALTCAALFAGTVGAAADTASPDAEDSKSGPTRAGTGFRDATAVPPGRSATANASSGDYLYWVFPLDTGQRATFKAEVELPEQSARHGDSTWRIDVYDGLRRRQPCMYGMQSRVATDDSASVELSCTLRPVRSLDDPWSAHPLPGSYYLRLTAVDAPEKDLGLPVRAQVEAVAKDAGGAHAVDGALSTPLTPGVSAGDGKHAEEPEDGEDGEDGASPDAQQAPAAVEPEDGWSSGRWSDRWIWTVAGGVLAALGTLGGYVLARGPGRPSRTPPRA
ncbi:hypothetical protein [Streptomyces qinglanensis]|uniref:hypothetical protein n=1 Tax=Streptomyces qinglanensis TaxID=943816 RepID=UPI0037B8A627